MCLRSSIDPVFAAGAKEFPKAPRGKHISRLHRPFDLWHCG
jgi:hypothetical protein